MTKKKVALNFGQKYPYYKVCLKTEAHLSRVLTPLNYMCTHAIFRAYWENNCILTKKLSTIVSILKPFLNVSEQRKTKGYKADLDPTRAKVKYILSTIVSTSGGVIGFSTDKLFIKIPHLDKQFYDLGRLSESYRKGANITNSKKLDKLSLRTKAVFNPGKNPYKSNRGKYH